ncbi:hypothetical protein DFH09DRAFT_1330842 [Mycena vulgaris]|nr:hypothetical protein DFH09DRAFT_1330842 [Mycena vulgaris]
MARRTSSTVQFRFRPDFPDETVERYPSLSLALGDSYPKVLTDIDSGDFCESDHEDTSASTGLPATAFGRGTVSSPTTSDLRSSSESLSGASSSNFYVHDDFSPTFQDLPVFAPNGSMNFPSMTVPTQVASDNDFIPITSDPSGIPSESSFMPSGMTSNLRSSETADDAMPVAPRKNHRPKVFLCDVCKKAFTRAPDLRTHQDMHTHDQRTDIVCSKFSRTLLSVLPRSLWQSAKIRLDAFSLILDEPICILADVGSNMPHRGRKQTDKGPPSPPFKITFENHIDAPPVRSDTDFSAHTVIWDRDGPFSRCRARSTGAG